MSKLPRKRRKDITISEETFEWIEQQIKESRFASFSHAVEYAIKQLMKRKE